MTGVWLGTLLTTFVMVMIAMLALGLGQLLNRRAPRGSCGQPWGDCGCDPRNRTCRSREQSP